MEKQGESNPPAANRFMGQDGDILKELSKKVSIMENIAKYTLLIMLSGIEEAETSGYERAVSVMVNELNKLAGWTTIAMGDTDGSVEDVKVKLDKMLADNPFINRHKN
ncbi:MAG: hypothetical protein HQK89_05815 [Nitrospirae bacterium]|nr:hypothetical protein [Nitrospirota bacterium]